ncbi:MAG: hypothetical protein WBX20_13370 [Terrimicrobiaceae bacterium]
MSAVENDAANEQHLQLENWQKKPSRSNVRHPVDARLLNTECKGKTRTKVQWTSSSILFKQRGMNRACDGRIEIPAVKKTQ